MKLLAGIFAAVFAAFFLLAPAADAKSFGGFRGGSSFRSVSRPTTSFSRPTKPTFWYKPVPKTAYRPAAPTYRPSPVYNTTTVVQQSSGGGFFSSMFGSIAGFGIAQWLFGDDKPSEVQAPPAAAPVPTVAEPVTEAQPTK